MLCFSIVHLHVTYRMSEERVRAYAKDARAEAQVMLRSKNYKECGRLLVEERAFKDVLQYSL